MASLMYLLLDLENKLMSSNITKSYKLSILLISSIKINLILLSIFSFSIVSLIYSYSSFCFSYAYFSFLLQNTYSILLSLPTTLFIIFEKISTVLKGLVFIDKTFVFLPYHLFIFLKVLLNSL